MWLGICTPLEPTENHVLDAFGNEPSRSRRVHIQKILAVANALGKVSDIQANSYHDEALKKVSAELNVVAYSFRRHY